MVGHNTWTNRLHFQLYWPDVNDTRGQDRIVFCQ